MPPDTTTAGGEGPAAPASLPPDHSGEIAQLRASQAENDRLLGEARAELAELKANSQYVTKEQLEEVQQEIASLKASNASLSADLRKAGEVPTLEPPAPVAGTQPPASGTPDGGAAPPGQEPPPKRSFRPQLPHV